MRENVFGDVVQRDPIPPKGKGNDIVGGHRRRLREVSRKRGGVDRTITDWRVRISQRT